MSTLPDFKTFKSLYEAGKNQALWTTMIADMETPVSAISKLGTDKRFCFLFESVEGAATLGRYSFIGLAPDIIWRCDDAKAEVNRDAVNDRHKFDACNEPPLESLRNLLAETQIDLPEELPPGAIGLFGFMGYDMVRLIEKLPDNNPDTLDIPESVMIRPTVTLVFDNIKHTLTIITPVWYSSGHDAQSAYEAAQQRILQTIRKLEDPVPTEKLSINSHELTTEPTSNMTKEEFAEMVEKTREYIYAGDIFQAVLSQRFEIPFSLPAFHLYRTLRRLNPSPFLVYFNFVDYALVCSSPEVLVRLRDNTVTIRPIAGTRKRGTNDDEDKKLVEDLLADPKECAEHLMLLDLGRNDVGRVSEIGSVKVTDRFNVELYSHVMHIVSNVEGTLSKDHDALSALFAGFPAGTVSGAPKIRAMEIIDELEVNRRSFYAGCIGYLGADGSLDSCIALRTALIKDGKIHIQAGGGIVADSTPEGEYQETKNKAQAIISAAKEALELANNA